MRTKDLDEVLPNVTVDVTPESVTIDGSRTGLVNGEVSQNGLELILRMERVAKDLTKAAKTARGYVQEALDSGTPVQDGNRVSRIEEKDAALSWKGEFEKLLKEEKGLTKKAIKTRCEALAYKAQVELLLEELSIDFETWEEEKKSALEKKKVLVIE